MNKEDAIKAIKRQGILLVFPANNEKDPPSLWQVAHPHKKMCWEWDDKGDNQVADLWHLRTELSLSRKVIYTKWYRGRATFFSPELFVACLAILSNNCSLPPLSRQALELLNMMEEESPLSTKQLKLGTNLIGRRLEGVYTRSLKELWSRLLIVAFGEVNEGAFPSLAIGSTKRLMEELYLKSQQIPLPRAQAIVDKRLGASPKFSRFWRTLVVREKP